jgi:hypothetical protein
MQRDVDCEMNRVVRSISKKGQFCAQIGEKGSSYIENVCNPYKKG